MDFKIDIPFGAHDSELKGWEYTIPEGFTAEIKDGKVIVREKESEDERIRKGLVEYHKQQYEKNRDQEIGLFHKDALAYLEKQKEEEGYEAIPVESTLEYKLGFKAGKESEKQKEQKHKRERNKPKESWLSKVKYELAHEEELLIKRQKELSEIRALKNKEQKSAEYGDDVAEEAEEYISKVDCGEYGVAVTEAYIAGVLSERNRKPAEWSEEDEDKLEQCIRIVSGWEGDYDIVKSPYSNFLKSLRPSWKPSEEQMEALEKASTNKYLSAEQYDILVSLYEQLKSIQ